MDENNINLSEEKNYAEPNQNLLSTHDINVQVSCEIGNVILSLDNLTKLKIGDSIDFIKWPGKVKLRVNGQAFAEGYLVEIKNMLGVKITNRLDNLNNENKYN